MSNIKDLVNEHKKPLKLLYECHGLMFESQLSQLLGLERRKTNRLVKELKTNKLVKTLKSYSSNVVCLTRLAATELLAPNTPVYLPDGDSTSRIWLGAYSADFRIINKSRFVSASHYKQAFHNIFSQAFAAKEEEIKKQTASLELQHALANKFRSGIANEYADMHQFFTTMKKEVPLGLTKQLLSKLNEAKESFLLKAIGSGLLQELTSIVEQQQKALTNVDTDLVTALNKFAASHKRLKSPLEINVEPIPVMPEIHFPDGANNLPYKDVSANANPSTATSRLISRNTLYVQLPNKAGDTSNWPGIGDVTSKRWKFIILDRGYGVGWYRNLLLQLALSRTRYDKARKCYVNSPNDKITFDLTVLTQSQTRNDALFKKLVSLREDNLQSIKSQQEHYTFADRQHNNWGLGKLNVFNMNTERLLLHSSQKMQPPCNLPNNETGAGANTP